MRHLLLFLLMTSGVEAASKHMVVLGGGGEKQGDSTIFDDDLKSLGLFAKNNPEYQTSLAFNGGHSVTEGIAREHFPSFDQSNHFTAGAFGAAIKSYEDKIITGEIKADDQILIHINTHGSSKAGDTHNIAVAGSAISNYDTLGSSTVSLDRLKVLAGLAEEKGVKLAIIDMSCHSGNSLPLANSKTCVITSTGPDHYAYGGSDITFSGRFNKSLAKGKNLEQAFMEVRTDYIDMSFPMISTPQGRDVQGRFYGPMTPYLYNYKGKYDKFSSFMEELVGNEKSCSLQEQHQTLIKEAEGILKIATDEKTKATVDEFKQAVRAYYAYLEEIRTKMVTMGFGKMKESFSFCTKIPADKKKKIKASKDCIEYTMENLMTLNFESISEYFEKQSLQGSPNDKAGALAALENIKKARTKRDEILKDHPEYSGVTLFWAGLQDLREKTSELGYAVSKAQREVYELLYRQSTAVGPNPCRDFVL